MKLKRIELAGFMSHKNTVLDLPPTGVLLFVGANGAGKSSIAEAIAYGRWGETLRGKSPWAGPVGHLIQRYDDGTTITRVRKAGKTDLKFNVGSASPVKYESPTKAQAALDLLVGSWPMWKKSAAFSSSDLASFTKSTDGERKRLVEELLGIDRFDVALKACRVDLGLAAASVSSLTRELASWTERLARAEALVKSSDEALALAGGNADVAALKAEVERLDGLYQGAKREAEAGEKLVAQAQQTGFMLSGEVSRTWERLQRFGVATCPTCEQEIGAELKEKVGAEARKKLEELKQAEADAASAAKEGQDEVDDLREEARGFRTKLDAARAAVASYEAGAASRAHAEGQKKKALTEREDAEDARDETTAKLAAAKAKVATLTAVERVLGLRGVRAHLLGDALLGLQDGANAWLGRIAGPGLRLTLNPYTDGSKEVISDKIAFDVEGAGNGHGYQGSSGGERRRLDVAIMLALGDMAAAAAGRSQDIVIFDEVFDSLDKAGVADVSDVMADLATERLCIVITHNEDVVQSLPVAAHYEVAAGALRKVR